MFSAVLFVEDPNAGQVIQELADDSGLITIRKTLHDFPSSYGLARVLNTHDPDSGLIDAYTPYLELGLGVGF